MGLFRVISSFFIFLLFRVWFSINVIFGYFVRNENFKFYFRFDGLYFNKVSGDWYIYLSLRNIVLIFFKD